MPVALAAMPRKMLPPPMTTATSTPRATTVSRGSCCRSVRQTSNRQVGLIVDGLVGEQEIVIKPLGQLLGDVAGLSGAAILGDGSVALIVDVAALIGRAIRDNTTVLRP